MSFSSINAFQDVQFVIYLLFTSTSNISTISYFLTISTKLRQMFGGKWCGLRRAMTVSHCRQWHWLCWNSWLYCTNDVN